MVSSLMTLLNRRNAKKLLIFLTPSDQSIKSSTVLHNLKFSSFQSTNSTFTNERKVLFKNIFIQISLDLKVIETLLKILKVSTKILMINNVNLIENI